MDNSKKNLLNNLLLFEKNFLPKKFALRQINNIKTLVL